MRSSTTYLLSSLLAGFLLSYGAGAFAKDGTLTFGEGRWLAEYTWTQGPRSPDSSTLQLQFLTAADHRPIEVPGSLGLKLKMPDMPGHFTPTPPIQAMDQLGVFQISDMYFNMPGVWETQVSLTYPDGTVETQSLRITLDAGGLCTSK